MRSLAISEKSPAVITGAIQDLASGHANNGGTITLTINVATSTLLNRGIAAGDAILLVPRTANAAAEIGNGTIYVTTANVTKGQAVITHANNAQADRTFSYFVMGIPAPS